MNPGLARGLALDWGKLSCTIDVIEQFSCTTACKGIVYNLQSMLRNALRVFMEDARIVANRTEQENLESLNPSPSTETCSQDDRNPRFTSSRGRSLWTSQYGVVTSLRLPWRTHVTPTIWTFFPQKRKFECTIRVQHSHSQSSQSDCRIRLSALDVNWSEVARQTNRLDDVVGLLAVETKSTNIQRFTKRSDILKPSRTSRQHCIVGHSSLYRNLVNNQLELF